MRNNQNITITGERVVLVPYKAEHVLKYHEWMKSSELQQLTASEPLSLEEEYDMQQKWAVDEDKCTFIVLDREVYEKTGDETAAMIGDTNLFFQSESGNNLTAEAEIMIAEKDYRRKRRGWEAVLLMLRYGCEHLDVKTYEVKISIENTRSINMFSKIGFQEVCRNSVFNEVTMKKIVDDEWMSWLRSETINSQIKSV